MPPTSYHDCGIQSEGYTELYRRDPWNHWILWYYSILLSIVNLYHLILSCQVCTTFNLQSPKPFLDDSHKYMFHTFCMYVFNTDQKIIKLLYSVYRLMVTLLALIWVSWTVFSKIWIWKYFHCSCVNLIAFAFLIDWYQICFNNCIQVLTWVFCIYAFTLLEPIRAFLI